MLTNSFNPASAGNGGATGAGALAPAAAPASETADMFTKLLVAQIRNQDPLAPTDPSQFVNQLSQLSQTEALQSLSKLTSSSQSVLQSLQVLALGAQVGSEVMAATASVQLADAPLAGALTLEAASGATSLVLTGADGRQHTLALGAHGPGLQAFSIDPAALGLAPGSYRLAVSTDNGQAPLIEVAGRLDSVRLSAGGGIVLNVAGVGEIAPSAVTGFNGKSGALASSAALASPAY